MISFNDEVKPMKLKEVSEPFNSKEYIFEPKYDGVRAIIHVSKNNIVIRNKNGRVMNEIFPELNEIKNMVKGECIFDGEIVLMDNDRPSFKKLQERIMLKDKKRIDFMVENYPVIYICFDVLYLNEDLTDKTLIERKNVLSKFKDNNFFVKTMYIENNGVKFFNIVKDLGLEGIVAKKKSSNYFIDTRSSEWIKIKNWKDSEFYIGGYFNNEKSPMATLVIGEVKNNKFFYSSKVTINKKSLEYQLIKSQKVLKSSPFEDFDSIEFIYIKPTLKCTIMYLDRTMNNHLRHPVYKGLRLD